jgi:hypothetical protein
MFHPNVTLDFTVRPMLENHFSSRTTMGDIEMNFTDTVNQM